MKRGSGVCTEIVKFSGYIECRQRWSRMLTEREYMVSNGSGQMSQDRAQIEEHTDM